jgi:hypothetical protein
MLDEMEPHQPTGIGVVEFAKCLRRLRDGHKGIALAHIRRALKAEPQNPFFLSYVGMRIYFGRPRHTHSQGTGKN